MRVIITKQLLLIGYSFIYWIQFKSQEDLIKVSKSIKISVAMDLVQISSAMNSIQIFMTIVRFNLNFHGHELKQF